MANGRPIGVPQLVKADIGPFQHGLGFTKDGSYYYSVSAWANDVYLAVLDPVSGKIGSPKKLVSHVGFDTSTEWSPNGQSLAYAWGSGWLYDPFVLGILDIETGKQRRMPLGDFERQGAGRFEPHWSPDGGSFLASARGRTGISGLHRIEARTGESDLITSAGVRWASAWAPDGRAIFSRRNAGAPGVMLVARDLTTNRETELYSTPEAFGITALAVSPNNQRLAFAWVDNKRIATTIEVMPADGSARPTRVVTLAPPGSSPRTFTFAWTPDSRRLIYATHAAEHPILTTRSWASLPVGENLRLIPRLAAVKHKLEVWEISADGGVPKYLGLALKDLVQFGLSVHPDGRRIAFTAGTIRRPEVWMLKGLLAKAPAK